MPGQQGDRVTVVCSPAAGRSRRAAVLSAAPPGMRPGEPMTLSNHVTGVPAAGLPHAAPSSSTHLALQISLRVAKRVADTRMLLRHSVRQ